MKGQVRPVIKQWIPRCLAFSLLICLLMAGAEAAAQKPSDSDEEARVHFRLGTAYYESGRFAQAAQEFKQAHELSQRTELLYNLFLAYRDAGETANAAAALRQYLAESPDVQERGKLEARLSTLEKILAEKGDQAVGPVATASDPMPEEDAPVVEEPAPVAPPEPAQDQDRLKWLPWTLMGVGGALVVGGVATGFMAKADEDKLESDCPSAERCTLTEGQVDKLVSSGSTKATVGDALWIGGAVTAVVGLTFVFWKPWLGAPPEAPPLQVSCTRGGCGAAWTQRF